MIKKTRDSHPFNSALECGLRSLIILETAFPLEYDLQRLVFYDYLLVHSGDAEGPSSIHPATPHRSGEVLVKRKMLEQGLILMLSRGLIARTYDSTGIVYSATDMATSYLDCLQSRYVHRLKERSSWVISVFNEFDDEGLESYFYKNLDRWGGEFEKEAILKHGLL